MHILKPSEAYRFLKHYLQSDVEEFWAVALGSEKKMLAVACLFRGTVDSCTFHPRDVFRFAYTHNASAVLVAHNHPSGNCEPSLEDLDVTKRLVEASHILGVLLSDHLIVAGDKYYSFVEAGLLAREEVTDLSPSDLGPL
jgi:DNA repair protein RadC